MREVRIAAIVEGHGECEAVPVLVRRIASEVDPAMVAIVQPTIRVPASRLLKLGELERSVELAARKLGGRGGILILIDCDWPGGCPARDGPALLARARGARSDMPVSVVLAKPEYEAWFLAAAESLRGKRRLSESFEGPPNPESVRGAKEWLSHHMRGEAGYSETGDQAALTELFDLSLARKAPSFDKCYREIRGLLDTLRSS